MKILLTGFEAFDQSSINPSEKIVQSITQDMELSPFVTPLILPVDYKTAPELLCKTIDSLQPNIILCLGEASGRPVISIERLAVNLMDFRIADNSGNKIEDLPVIPGGPAAYFSSIPIRKIFQNIREAKIPAELSLSAGAYLCNQILYSVLDKICHDNKGQLAGFIHVPSLPEQVVEKDKFFPSMALSTSLEAIKIALKTILN